jgi:hypothetical protein
MKAAFYLLLGLSATAFGQANQGELQLTITGPAESQ